MLWRESLGETWCRQSCISSCPPPCWESLHLCIYIHTSTHRELLFRQERTVILNGSQWRTRSACEAALHLCLVKIRAAKALTHVVLWAWFPLLFSYYLFCLWKKISQLPVLTAITFVYWIPSFDGELTGSSAAYSTKTTALAFRGPKDIRICFQLCPTNRRMLVMSCDLL